MKPGMKQTDSISHLLATALLAIGLLAPLAVPAANSNPVVEIAGMEFNTDHTMVDNLKAHQGKRLTLHLSSGARIAGKVKAVSQHMVYLEKISKRDFMDALVRIEAIEAVEGQFRAYQRDLERMGLQQKP